MIDTALELFYQYGFHAVGVDHIITKAGVTKTTFYYHFPSKDDLAVAALQRRDQWEGQAFLAQLRSISKRPHEQLLAVFDVMDQWFNDPAYRGCLFINACAEFPLPHDPCIRRCQKLREQRSVFQGHCRGCGLHPASGGGTAAHDSDGRGILPTADFQ
ncbi:MAG: TetR/AcrR family transcriptional regulator [Phycisphaerales bacterium]|nr:TetR/AcrR family transcriptional regulator [Phycisphaerales bacterium]